MKKILLSAVCVSVLTFGALVVGAQEGADSRPLPPPPHEMNLQEHHEKMSQKLAEDLGLSDEQKSQADKIREEGRKKMEPLMKEKKILHQKMDAVRKSNMEDFEKILTPEQRQKFSEIKAKHKAHAPKFGHRKHDLPKGQRPDVEPKNESMK